MNALVVLLLAVLWVSILAPGAVRGRRRPRSPRSSVDAFERTMGVLAAGSRRRAADPAPHGRQVLVPGGPPGSDAAARRRRTIARRKALLQVLAAGVLLSGAPAVVLGAPFTAVFAGALAALFAYAGLLVRLRVAAERTRDTVRPFPVVQAPGPEDGAPAAAGEEQPAPHQVAAVGGGAL